MKRKERAVEEPARWNTAEPTPRPHPSPVTAASVYWIEPSESSWIPTGAMEGMGGWQHGSQMGALGGRPAAKHQLHHHRESPRSIVGK